MKNEKEDKNILLQDELFLSKYISQNSKNFVEMQLKYTNQHS